MSAHPNNSIEQKLLWERTKSTKIRKFNPGRGFKRRSFHTGKPTGKPSTRVLQSLRRLFFARHIKPIDPAINRRDNLVF